MPDQIGYFASLKNAAGKVFSYLASITLTGTDGKTITCTENTTLNSTVPMADLAPKASPTFTTKITTPIIDLTGGQIAFPAAQAASADANTLDDYEEGTWTPVIAFGGAAVGVTYGGQVGAYVKIGKVVFFTCRLVLSSNGTSVGVATIGGLPFTPDGTNYLRCLAAARVSVTLTREMYGKINVNEAAIYLITAGGNESALTEVEIGDAADIFAIGHFYI